MKSFEFYSPGSEEKEFLVAINECLVLEEAIRYYRNSLLEYFQHDSSTISILDTFQAYLRENPKFILSNYYARLTVDI